MSFLKYLAQRTPKSKNSELSTEAAGWLNLRFAVSHYGIQTNRWQLIQMLKFYVNAYENDDHPFSKTLDDLVRQKMDQE